LVFEKRGRKKYVGRFHRPHSGGCVPGPHVCPIEERQWKKASAGKTPRREGYGFSLPQSHYDCSHVSSFCRIDVRNSDLLMVLSDIAQVALHLAVLTLFTPLLGGLLLFARYPDDRSRNATRALNLVETV
jgi:hypothetical protein